MNQFCLNQLEMIEYSFFFTQLRATFFHDNNCRELFKICFFSLRLLLNPSMLRIQMH